MIERVSYEAFNDIYRVKPSITEEEIITPSGQVIDGTSPQNIDAVIKHDEEHPNTVWSIIEAEVIDPEVYRDEDYEESDCDFDPVNDDSEYEDEYLVEDEDDYPETAEEYHIIPGIEEIHAIGYIVTEVPYVDDEDLARKCFVLDI